MSSRSHHSGPLYGLLHAGVDGMDSLAELALDMRSSWNHATDQVWTAESASKLHCCRSAGLREISEVEPEEDGLAGADERR